LDGAGIGVRIVRAMTQQIRLFFTALQFYTRLPVPRWVGFEESWLQPAVCYLPLVGWIVAALCAAIYRLAVIVWPPAIAVLLSVAGGLLLTGALHEDGFADMCDGFGGGAGRQRVLDIMKDSRIGAYGAIGIGLLLALKCVALVSMASPLVPLALLVAHPVSRLFSASLTWRLDYARSEGKAAFLSRRMTGGEFSCAALTALLPACLALSIGLISWKSMVTGILLAALVCVLLARLFLRRIGGYTGDCLGAVQQATEVGFYLGFLAC
jgi:adenosylcobinamide-GDP ribazoletransferase